MYSLHKSSMYFALVLLLTAILILTGRFLVDAGYSEEITRVGAEEARSEVFKGKALLVCAYEGIEAYKTYALEGSISLDSLNEFSEEIDKDKKIIFYCN